MRRFSGAIAVALSFGLLLIACDRAPTGSSGAPEKSPDRGSALSTHQVSPHSVLSGSTIPGASTAQKGPAPGPRASKGNGFKTPLFGLATAPNGDVLVADAGAGIATLSGATDIALPGVTDMSPLGRGTMWATKGLTGAPGEDTGQGLYRASKGKNRLIADLFAFEKEKNPDGAKLIDSNPFDVQALGGQAALVADAGANDLLHVDNQGNIEVLAVFPNESVPTDNIKNLFGCPEGPPSICGLPPKFSAQAVPTSVAIGPDGYYYVGELKGFPAPTGESNIWKVAPDASWAECGPSSPDCEKVFDGGFTSIIDLRFDESGTLHVVELEENSWFALELDPPQITRGTINACDLGTETCDEAAKLPIVTAITFGNDGSLWATKNALIPGKADVAKSP